MHSYVPLLYLQYVEEAANGFALNGDTTSIFPYPSHTTLFTNDTPYCLETLRNEFQTICFLIYIFFLSKKTATGCFNPTVDQIWTIFVVRSIAIFGICDHGSQNQS